MGDPWAPRVRFAAAALAAGAAVWCVHTATDADAAPRGTPPRLVSFSPAAVHPGGLLLLDADLGGRAARVRIGGRAAQARRARPSAGSGGAPDRLWVRVPRKLAAGSHEITLTTRAGRAAAAKPVVVATCNPRVTTTAGGCGGTLQSGASLQANGMGYSARLDRAAAVEPAQAPSQTVFGVESGPVGLYVNLPVRRDQLAPGPVAADSIVIEDFTGGFRGYWETRDGTVEVVEVSPTRVRFCFDVVLQAAGNVQPTEVTVTGFVVIQR